MKQSPKENPLPVSVTFTEGGQDTAALIQSLFVRFIRESSGTPSRG